MKYCPQITVAAVVCAGGMICPAAKSQTPCDNTVVGVNAIRQTKAINRTFGDRYGTSVGVAGDLAVSGAPQIEGTQSGFAIIHSRHQGGLDGWGEIKRLTSPDDPLDQLGDQFGISVGVTNISGDTIIVGAHRDNSGVIPILDAGSAFIFEPNQGGAGNWGVSASLVAPDAAADDRFGFAVAISGDICIVGAPRDDTSNGMDAGSAYIYRRDGNGVWQFEQKIEAGDGLPIDRFGFSVDIERDMLWGKDIVAVGSLLDDNVRGIDAGSVYVFRYDPATGGWGQEGRFNAPLTPNATEDFVNAQFGNDVGCWRSENESTEGDLFVGGAHLHDITGPPPLCPVCDIPDPAPCPDYGAAYAFRKNATAGTPVWDDGFTLLPEGCLNMDMNGRAVDIQDTRVILSSFHANDEVVLFERVGLPGNPNNWVERLTLIGGGLGTGQSSDEFGNAVALDGGTMIAGAHVEGDASAVKAGRAYVVNGLDDCNGNQIIDACEIKGNPDLDCNGNGNLDLCGNEVFGCPGDIVPASSQCPGGVGNGLVNIDDLVALLNAFGDCPAPPADCPADITPPGGNGTVNIDDLVAVLNAFGTCPLAGQSSGGSGASGITLEAMDFSNGWMDENGVIDTASSALVAGEWLTYQNQWDVYRLWATVVDQNSTLTFAGGGVASGVGGISEPLVLSAGKNATFNFPNGSYTQGVNVAMLAYNGGPGFEFFQTQAFGTYITMGMATGSNPMRLGDVTALDAILTGAVNEANTGWGVFGSVSSQYVVSDGNGGWRILIGQFAVPKGSTFTAAVRLVGDVVDTYATISSGTPIP